jgi:cytochrome b561
LGYFLLAATASTDPAKIALLRLPMAGGMLILFLMIVRCIVRLWTSRPLDATTGNSLLRRMAFGRRSVP